ncbi:MAG: molybdopterin-guanine dinucleotide biosynthesis protein B [Alphaproteobacteria bacterium CG_4_10_14_0_2_um_filter_63_37]|nr:MAG: molybdopterin-guanine dinucleotide biosynthesis protein B [Proteobacteria bacterium CG1_02_64_396]PJA25600.1 MAG: molybdopterin-guanine dinucleotide biosynthesis protein B [Alphaproteobacteria bacterium CG_4_10_14_0_2_um_filter_63_37]
MNPPVVCFVGPSGSGKTTLLEKVVAILSNQGIKVATLKQTHHPVEWDTPGKDTFRMRRAGAAVTLLATPHATFLAQPAAAPQPLEALLPLLPPADLVLAEGFKSSPFPKLAVLRAAHPWNPGDLIHVVALACDLPPSDAPWRHLDINAPAAVAAWLQERLP